MAYKDLEKQRAFQREWQNNQRLLRKMKVVNLLGGKCVECGYAENIAALQIDHIEPALRSNAVRNAKKDSGVNLLRKICCGKLSISDFQLLCANCHAIKTQETDRKKFRNWSLRRFTDFPPSRAYSAPKRVFTVVKSSPILTLSVL